MHQVAGQGQTALVPAGEALAYIERCRVEGRLTEAEDACRRAIEERPDLAEPHHLLGLVAFQNGKLDEAIEHIERAIQIAPRVALFHANQGEMLRIAGCPRQAVKAARRALKIEPKMAAALSNLGVALYELKEYREAAAAQRKAIAAQPDFAEAHCNLGNALYILRRFDEAIAAYRRALKLKPDYADAWANLGTTLHHSGDFENGAVALRRAIALSPGHANAHSGLGILLLMRGDFGEGWEEYEWRLRSTERTGPRFPEIPWQGDSLAGEHIYVQAEQGFGDTLQFARYLPLLAARAGHVTVRSHQQLTTLLRESLPGITVLGDRGDPTPYQCDALLLSLPRLFKTRFETIPAEVPYLRVPADAAQRWSERVASMKGLKVGLVWAGNPEHANDLRRSIEFKLLAPLLDVAGASFASLQFGVRAADFKRLRGRKVAVADLARDFGDFTDTAGAVAALDLVVTVDTSVAHLSGALGKPTWVLLPCVSDWRWMLHREDNQWYPTMRLYRQKEGESWTDVIASVARDLKAVAEGDAARLMPFKAKGECRAAAAAAILAAQAAQAASILAPAPAPSAGQLLIHAEQKRRCGFLADAAELARRAATLEPDNAEAAHLLGIIAHQSGKLAEAIEHVRRAVSLKPTVALYHTNLAEMCRLAGRVDDAIAAGSRAIALDPNYPGAHNNVGIAYFEKSQFEQALACYDRAIALQGDFAEAHSNRGNALQRLKRFAEAERSYRRAVDLQPSFAGGWNNLGTCLRELKRLEEAETVYRKALELGPNNPDTLDNLALAVKDLERLDEAAELMRQALSIEARVGKFHVHHAAILLDQKKIGEAAAALDRALALDPNNHDAYNLMGRVACERGELPNSLTYYRRALALKPDLADGYNNMGNTLKELGQLDEAYNAFVQALQLDPNIAGVYVNLADSKTFKFGDAHLAAMERLAASPAGLSTTDRMQLDFALGKAYADLKDHDRSFKHMLAGNAAKRKTIDYDERAAFAFFERIEETFTRDAITQKSGGGDPSPMPIFVIGMPRSGTTLVEQILASHPMVHGAGELQTFNDVVLNVRSADGNTVLYPEFMGAITHDALAQLGAQYLVEIRKLAAKEGRANAERITDKMPSNYYFTGLIHLTLPNAKIIHTIRDPVDTCMSCFSKLFSAEQNHTYDLGELGRYYKVYERLMTHWHRVLPAGRILDVRYEDIVADVEKQMRRIIAHCGLPWNDRCSSFHKTDRPVRTASATQVRRPIYKTAIGRSRVYGQHLGTLLTALGIETPGA